MEQASLHIYKIARSIIVTMLLAFLIVYTALYVVLSVPAVQNKIRTTAEEELSKFLKTNVTIGKIEINPFSGSKNRLFGTTARCLKRPSAKRASFRLKPSKL